MNEQTRPTEGISVSPAESTAVAPRVATLLDAAAARLAKAGVDTARHDAKLLLAEATGSTPSDVDKAALMDDTVDQLTSAAEDGEHGNRPAPLAEFESMLARREAREPLQHIVGHAPFRYLELEVGPGVFVPRPETKLVVQ